ncbi:MAG TPA: medium chain dehydrogenase/reductase family protein [Candidatus Binatus sp.]|jgi:synaptic vesicle membrane protein VAT-1|nr:medium chain dehydrogenase/reductase family protein [Candidatus Binatus sp.]
MRSVWIPRTGPPEVLEVREGPDPQPGPGEVLVRVRASGVNFADVMARLGLYPDAPRRPCVVGYEVAGTVERVGAGVDGQLTAGRRVVALTRFGGYAEAVSVPALQVFPLPEKMSFPEGAAIPVNYLTAVLMLRHFGNVRAGDRVLVHAAAGGVGMAAIQLCRIAGADVFGTASAGKHALLREAGVAHAIDYRTEDFEAAVQRLTGGRGVDIVLDATGAFRKSYRCLAPLGRLVCFGLSGAATGMKASYLRTLPRLLALPWFHPIRLMNDNKAVIGVNLGHLWDRIDMLRREMLDLLVDYEAGRIHPVVGKTFPLTEAAAAHRYIQERQNVGKVVLTVD